MIRAPLEVNSGPISGCFFAAGVPPESECRVRAPRHDRSMASPNEHQPAAPRTGKRQSRRVPFPKQTCFANAPRRRQSAIFYDFLIHCVYSITGVGVQLVGAKPRARARGDLTATNPGHRCFSIGLASLVSTTDPCLRYIYRRYDSGACKPGLIVERPSRKRTRRFSMWRM